MSDPNESLPTRLHVPGLPVSNPNVPMAAKSSSSEDESLDLFELVTGLQKSDDETSSEYGPDDAAAAMDLYSDDDYSTGKQDNLSSDEEVSPSAVAQALRMIGPYTPSSFTDFKDEWLGSD